MHENGHVSTKDEFFADYLSRGYQEAVSVPKEIMRQFGNTVIVLFNAHYRHLNEPDRSSSQAGPMSAASRLYQPRSRSCRGALDIRTPLVVLD